jgi:tetratricopeptide (TPR) repeat protein
VLRDAVLFFRLGDQTSAQHVLDGGIERARAFLAQNEVPRARYLLSRLLRVRGQADAALAELQLALAADPLLQDARFERGLLFAARPDLTATELATAIADLSVPADERSVLTNVDRLFGRGERLRLAGEPTAAMAILREVLEYDPTHIGARVALSRAALALGESDLGRYYAASAFDFAQGYGPVYLAREQQILPTTMLGLDGALIDFAPALRDSPGNVLALAHRGLVQLRRALRLDADGDEAAATTAIEAAIADHTTTLAMHDGQPGALNNRAVCRLVAERLRAKAGDSAGAATERQAAEADLQRALAADATAPELLFNLGLCALHVAEVQRRLGRLASGAAGEARNWFERALQVAPPKWAHAATCRAHLDASALLASTR